MAKAKLKGAADESVLGLGQREIDAESEVTPEESKLIQDAGCTLEDVRVFLRLVGSKMTVNAAIGGVNSNKEKDARREAELSTNPQLIEKKGQFSLYLAKGGYQIRNLKNQVIHNEPASANALALAAKMLKDLSRP
jgi:hypothetical protein